MNSVSFKKRITSGFLVRFHMALILLAVIGAGILSSKGLLESGVHSMAVRYPLAILFSYCVFLALVRIWIWYVSIRNSASFNLGNVNIGSIDLSGGPGGGTGIQFHGFGGGDSGGAGASDSWGTAASVEAPSSSSLDLGIDSDVGDDGWEIVLVLAAVALVMVLAGGYLIYVAPDILPEAAAQVAFASAITRVKKQEQHHGWMTGVLRSTAIPFIIVMLVASGLGWNAQRHCPQATKLKQVLNCPEPNP
jgi:hypothetical protein